MRQIAVLMILGLSVVLSASAQSYKFDFTPGKKVKDGYVKVTPTDRYDEAKGYGYEFISFSRWQE